MKQPHVPMAQSALFAIACAGLVVGALASVKSVGQAAIGLIILWGTPVVVNEGSREMADIPLAFFILATGTLIYLYVLHKKPGLLALAGLTAGLAAWTKNEGSVIVIAAGLGLVIAFFREKPLRTLGAYALGLVLPLAVVLYFKFFIAPPSDVLSNGVARSIAQVLDPSRHAEILRFLLGRIHRFRQVGDSGAIHRDHPGSIDLFSSFQFWSRQKISCRIYRRDYNAGCPGPWLLCHLPHHTL